MRWRLDLGYDGTGFTGWAIQPGQRTVQGVLEHWLQQVLRLPEPVTVTVAGRTDAGVHARAQVVHVDLPDDLNPASFLRHPPDQVDVGAVIARRLRRALPCDIVVSSVQVAPPGFDARFSALWRRYAYRLTDGPPDPITRSFVAEVSDPFDIARFNEAASALLGLRDFAPFCKRRDGATTIRHLLRCEAHRHVGGVIEASFVADAFCHSMVRSLMGALTQVATGRQEMAWLLEVSARSSRVGQIPVMPAKGLVLEEVGYPTPDQLAARAQESRAYRSVHDITG